MRTIIRLYKNGTIWVIILYLLLSVLTSSVSFYLLKQQELNMLTRGLYDPKALSFTTKDPHQITDWRKLHTTQPFTLFNELEKITDQGKVYEFRAFFFSKHTYLPPMISGRFFQPTDFYQGKRVAVIGKDLKRPVKKNEKTYYPFAGKEFEVIGVVGASYATKMDRMIFLNIDGVDRGNLSHKYVMNITDHSFRDSLPFTNGSVPIDRIDGADQGVQRFLDIDLYQSFLLLSFLIILIMLSMLVSQYWIRKRRSEIRVLWHLGIPVLWVLKRYMLNYFQLIFISYGVIFLSSYLFLPRPEGWMTHSLQMGKGFTFIFVSAAVAFTITFHKSRRQLIKKGLSLL